MVMVEWFKIQYIFFVFGVTLSSSVFSPPMMETQFIPATPAGMKARGWEAVDVILVTGDAYVDHPSYGVAVIGRWLEAHGFRVAILAQPDHQDASSFKAFGRPRLFFGITAGNLDSIVANYTGNAKVRDEDQYSPNGNPYWGKERIKTKRRRPDRAIIRYANLARAAYADVAIVLGGVEASLRRFIHYDFQQEKLRASALTDAKADLLVYGMGERAVLEIAQRLKQGSDLHGIPGTCERLTDTQRGQQTFTEPPLVLPGWEEIQADLKGFMTAELAIDRHSRTLAKAPLLQRQQSMWVIQHQAAEPLTVAELDAVYALPFARAPHPDAGDVPAFRMIRDSVTIVRGCFGNCSFCAISRHQGPLVVSRSPESIIKEVQTLAQRQGFSGTISDLGGPTANLYGVSCSQSKKCLRHDCLYPKICRHLCIDSEAMAGLLEQVSAIKGVRHVFVSSGLRLELLLRTPKLLARLLAHHIPGAMKIAPEHTEEEMLRLMHKPTAKLLPEFLHTCRRLSAKLGKTIHFTPYLISSHPGCTEADMKALAQKIAHLGLTVRQLQDFTPSPGTLSTAMYVTGLDRDTLRPLFIPRGAGERRRQRKMLENG